MYEAARARPAGPSTVARLAATAADCGYDGLVAANPAADRPAVDREAVAEAWGVDVVDAVVLEPEDPAAASGAIGHHRPEATVLIVRARTHAVAAHAARQAKVDVLVPPADGGDLDDVLVNAAAEHGVRLGVDLGPALRSRGPERTDAIAGLRKLRELLEHADAPYVVTGSAGSHLELRAPRELAAVAATAGFEREAVEAGLAEWGRLAERNRERLSGDYVAPGVRREGDG